MLHGLMELAFALDEAAAMEVEARHIVAGMAVHVLHEHVVDGFGSSKLAPLAQATQDDRVSKGYTPNDPLLRDGSLLRDNVEMMHEGAVGGVGSSEPVQRDHEYGYINARTGTPVPPRPVFKNAMVDSQAKILAIVEASLPVIFGGKPGVELNP